MIYDMVLKEVFRNKNEVFPENIKYLEFLKKAHLFILEESVVENVKAEIKNLSFRDIVRGDKILTPFKNIWIEAPNLKVVAFENGKEIKRDIGFHLYELNDDVYVLRRFELIIPEGAPENIKGFLGSYTNIFRIENDSSEVTARSIYGVNDPCERAAGDATAYYDDVGKSKLESKFCGEGRENCSPGCIESIAISKGSLDFILTVLAFINTPYYRIVFKSNNITSKSSGRLKKDPQYGLNRPHYILIDHERTVNLFKNSEEYKKGSSNYKIRRGHDRRKHKRMVTGRQGKNGWIPYKEMVQWVRETWVGPKDFTVGESIYKIIDSVTK